MGICKEVAIATSTQIYHIMYITAQTVLIRTTVMGFMAKKLIAFKASGLE